MARDFRRFVRRFIAANFKPLEADADLSVESWLKDTRYPEWRKQELLNEWKKVENPLIKNKDGTYKYGKVKSFVKLESYPEYKHARCINSRHDIFKCLVGPAFHAIDEVVYKNKYFIKKIPVADRPAYIRENVYVPGRKYIVTDHSQYEAAFTRDLMEDCEFQLYDYMLRNHPQRKQFMALMREVVADTNVCHFKDLVIEIEATRMSGEMCTSLGNGFANLCSFLFEAERNKATDVRGVVEGDDGLFSLQGNHPTKEGLAENGFTVKMEVVEEFNESSFCGFMFDPQEGINIKQPLDLLVNFGWLPARYLKCNNKKLMGLYRCKALSYAFQFPGCPIVDAFARYVLRMTEGNRAIILYNDSYMYDKMKTHFETYNKYGLKDVRPGVHTRALFAKKFGVLPHHQIQIEKYFENCKTFDFACPLLDSYQPTINYNHFNNYTHGYSTRYPANAAPLNHVRNPVERDPESLLPMASGRERPSLWSVPRK